MSLFESIGTDWVQIAGPDSLGLHWGTNTDTAALGLALLTTAGFDFEDNSADGVLLKESGSGGIFLHNLGDGGLSLRDDGSGGILLKATGSGGINFQDQGDGGFNVNDSGLGGINLASTSSGGFNMNAGSSGFSITGQLPTSNPGGTGKWWMNAGVLTINP